MKVHPPLDLPMRFKALFYVLKVGLFCVFFSTTGAWFALPAQSNIRMPDAGIKQEIARVERYLRSFKNDTAKIIAANLLATLEAQGQLNSYLGVRAQLAAASAYEQDQDNEVAIQKLLQVKKQCETGRFADLHAQTNLVLALLYEKIGREGKSLIHLRESKTDIDQYNLDSIYPYYAIRMASWQRIYGNQDSAIYFAREALRTAPAFNLDLETAIGHMLMNMVLPREAFPERFQHAFSGLRLYQKIEDYTGCSYMYGAIASLYFQQKNIRQALIFNDSALIMANLAIAEGHEQHYAAAAMYRFQGELFKALGQSDSAWYYLNKGYQMELAQNEKEVRERVIEIDARYNNAKKQLQLDEQAQQLASERLRRNWLLAGLFLVLLLTAALAYFYAQLRKANEKNRRQAEQLASLDAAKSRFFANISHELRTPLTLLLGPVNTMLKEATLSDKQRRLLEMARRNGDQLGQLINEILDLRKLEMGQMQLLKTSTALRRFFQNHVAQFESLADSKQIDFIFRSTVPANLVATIDREKCRQVLTNLLSNAFKFTPAGGRVSVELSIKNGMLDLRVADTGPGIHPDDLPQVFDRFFQTSRPDKPAEGGTGIGLNLCKEYARLFGGDISAQSSPGAGSTFRMRFPVNLVEQAAQAVPGQSAEDVQNEVVRAGKQPVESTANLKGKSTILVVEDNPDLQDYIRLILSETYQVVTAANGQAALDYLLPSAGSQQPTANCQLVLSDLMMPVMDGYHLLEKLKSNGATRQIPVIMLTARAEARARLKALRIGVDDYLTKPFNEEELLARIANLLKNQAARLREIQGETAPVADDLSGSDRDWLESFEVYVQKNIASHLLTVPALALEFAMSESTLLRQLKRLTGLTPQQYLQEIRLDIAREMLESRQYNSIAVIASTVGYFDVRSFSRRFQARFGKLPSEVL
ncbi:MAG: response regulator [Saprospiraceae bacterium]